MYDIDAMLNAICERVGVPMETAEKLAARDTYEAQLVLDRKAAMARSCGNCTKSHDPNAPSGEACEYIVQKRLAEIYLRLARLNAPMGVMPCTKCQGASVIGLGVQAPCDACDGRGWWYMKGDARATEATVQPDVLPAAAPIPKPEATPRAFGKATEGATQVQQQAEAQPPRRGMPQVLHNGPHRAGMDHPQRRGHQMAGLVPAMLHQALEAQEAP